MINIKLFELVINDLYKKIEELEKSNDEFCNENAILKYKLSEYGLNNNDTEFEYVDKDTL